MEGWRAAAALLLLAATIQTIISAPLNEQTALDVYDGDSADGCYYNFQHYGEGDRIMTNEPCLNCTCHNRMLMCYLRVCPFTKPIGQDCSVEKRGDQCCPVITCPDVPVDLLTSTSTASPSDSTFTDVGHLDRYGCSIDGRFYAEGSKVPAAPNKPCELCYCIRNMTACVMQECTLHVDGCTPVYRRDVCCPVRYSCDHPDEDLLQLDDLTTTVRPTPGFMLTTTVPPGVTQDCVHDDNVYADGALIKTEKACEHCYCMKGDIVCVVQECGAPMENEGKNCTALAPREGQCCPDTYICEGDDESSTDSTELPEISTIADPHVSNRNELPQEEVPVHDKQPDDQDEIPQIQETLPHEEVSQSSLADDQDSQEKIETTSLITTEATAAPVEEISTSAITIESGNTILPAIPTDEKQEEIITESTTNVPEGTTVKISQTTLLPLVDVDTETTEENPETELTSTPEHIDEASKTTKGFSDHFTGITTKALPDFPTKSDVDIIGENLYTTHTNPTHDRDAVMVTESIITPSEYEISTSSEGILSTSDDSSEIEQSLMTEVPETQSLNTLESSSETDISTRIFTSKSPSRTTPIASETSEPTTSAEVLESESTQAPLVHVTSEERLPAPSTSTPETFTSSEGSTDMTAPVTEQHVPEDVTTVKFEDTHEYDITTVPTFETSSVPISDTDKFEDATVKESTTEYVTSTSTHGDSDKLITVSHISELSTTVKFDIRESTTLAPTTIGHEYENEIHEEDQAPILPYIPGEGDCLVDGITYINDSIIPNANKCVISCRCVSSIVHCDQVACNPPPEEMINCEPMDVGKDSCCPTYVCDQSKLTLKPESDNQMSEFTSTYTPHIVDDGTTTQVPAENPSVQGVQNKFQDSETVTPVLDVLCDSVECQTKEESKPNVQPITESGIDHPQSIEDVDCETAECKFTKQTQKPIQDQENSYTENPVVIECAGNDCPAKTESVTVDLTTSSILSEITTPPPRVLEEIPIENSFDTKPCDGSNCPTEDKIATPVENSPTEFSLISESGEATTEETNFCKSGNCENPTTIQSLEGESTGGITPLTSINIQNECKSEDCKTESELQVPSTSDECVGVDCTAITDIPAVDPMVCTSDDCSEDLAPSEPATIIPTKEVIKPCDSDDCQPGTQVTTVTSGELNTEEPIINEIVCTAENCKYPVQVSPTSVETVSEPEISHNDENINDIPIPVDKCTTSDCISQENTEYPITEMRPHEVECTGEKCITPNIAASSVPGQKPADSECNGTNCVRLPTDECSSSDCSTQYVTSSSVTSSGQNAQDVTVSSVIYHDSETQDVTDSSVMTPEYSVQDIETSTITYPDHGTPEVSSSDRAPYDSDSENFTSSSVTTSDLGIQDGAASPVTYPGHDSQDVTSSPAIPSDLGENSSVTYPDRGTQETPAPSSDSGNQDTTEISITSSDRDTQDVTGRPITEIDSADVECKGDDCEKLDEPLCSSPECLSQAVTTSSTPEENHFDCKGDDCVNVPAPICTTPECNSSSEQHNIPAGLGCDGNDCGSQGITDVTQLGMEPAGLECDGDGCVKVPTSECSSDDCVLQSVTDGPIQQETPGGVLCDSGDCVKAPQPEDNTVSGKPDDSGCDGDNCVGVQKPGCSSSDCSLQDDTAIPISEVKPELTDCDGEHCIQIDTPECSLPDCVSHAAAVPESQFKPTSCQGDECGNVQVPECTSSDCAVLNVTTIAVPEVRPIVDCDGEDCKVQPNTEINPQTDKGKIPKIPTEVDTIEVTTESVGSLTTPQNLVPNKDIIPISTTEKDTPASFGSYPTTPLVQEDEQPTPNTDIYYTTLSDDIHKVQDDTEGPSIDEERIKEETPELSGIITTDNYDTAHTRRDEEGTTTHPMNIEVITTSEVSIDDQTTNKPDSDSFTTHLPEESFDVSTQTTTPSSEQEAITDKPSSQETDQLPTELYTIEPITDIPTFISSTDNSQTANSASDEQEYITESGVSQSSTELSDISGSLASTTNGEIIKPSEEDSIISAHLGTSSYPSQQETTTETIIESPEQGGDSNADSETSSTTRPLIDIEESQPQTTSAQINIDETEGSQTTEISLSSTSIEEDKDKPLVSPVTPETVEAGLNANETPEIDDRIQITKSPSYEATTFATFEISTELDDKPLGTEDTTGEIQPDIVDSDKENDNETLTVKDKVQTVNPKQPAEDFTKRPDENSTIKTETSTELDIHPEVTTNSNIDVDVSTTYSSIEVFVTPEATPVQPGPEEFTSTTLLPPQSTERINVETNVSDTTDSSFGITQSSTLKQDNLDISTVMSEAITLAPILESDSLVTPTDRVQPDIDLLTTVVDPESGATSVPTANQTDVAISADAPLPPVTESIVRAEVEVPNVNKDITKPIDDYVTSTSAPVEISTIVDSKQEAPHKEQDEESDDKQTTSIESSTPYSGENVVTVTSIPAEIQTSPGAPLSINTEKSSVSVSVIPQIVDSSTAVPEYDSRTETLPTKKQTTTVHDGTVYFTTPSSDTEIETEPHVAPEVTSYLPPKKESEAAMAPDNVEDISTTTQSVVTDEKQTTSQEILSAVTPTLGPVPTPETSGVEVTPDSEDANNLQTTTSTEIHVPINDGEISIDFDQSTTGISDDTLNINVTPTTIPHVYEITSNAGEPMAETTFAPTTALGTNIGEGGNESDTAATTTSAPYKYEISSTPSNVQTVEDIEQDVEKDISTSSPAEDNISQVDRFKPVSDEDVTTLIPIESENITEQYLSTHGDSIDVSPEFETSTTPSHSVSVAENIETTPTSIEEEENIKIPVTAEPTYLERVPESEISPATIEPEVILEGSGHEPESEIYNPFYTETTTSAASDSKTTPEQVVLNVSVSDNELYSELDKESDDSTTISAVIPTTTELPLNTSQSSTTEHSVTGVSDLDITNEVQEEMTTESNVNVEISKHEESDISTPPSQTLESGTVTDSEIGVEPTSTSSPGTFLDTNITTNDITGLVSDISTPKSEQPGQMISISTTEDLVILETGQTDRPDVISTETTTLPDIDSPDKSDNRFGTDGNIVTSSSLDVPETSVVETSTKRPQLSTLYVDDITMTTTGPSIGGLPETITRIVTDQSTVQPQFTVSEEIESHSTTPSESEQFVSLTTLLGIPTGSGLMDNVTPSHVTTASDTVYSTGSTVTDAVTLSQITTGSETVYSTETSSDPDADKTSILMEKTTISPPSGVDEVAQPQTPSIEDISKPDELTPTKETSTTSRPEEDIQEIQKPISPEIQSNLPSSSSVGIPLPGEDSDHQMPESSFPYGQQPEDYDQDEEQSFGPGTCRYGGKVYVSAQQIPRDDPCDFCFCFRSDIICLQQSCPPPIHGCHEEPISGFCCPRYECPVSMATTLNVTSTTTTTTTTLPPHFLPHAYKGAAQRRGCQIKGHSYQVGENVRASSGPCLHCTCGGDGQMKCDPKVCTPEPMLRQMIAAAVSTKRRR